MLLSENDEPQNNKQVLNSEYMNKLVEGIESELSSSKEDNTWTLATLPKGKNIVKTIINGSLRLK